MMLRRLAFSLATACLLLLACDAAPPNTNKVMFKFSDYPGGAMQALGPERLARIARNSRQTGLSPKDVADALNFNDDMVSMAVI